MGLILSVEEENSKNLKSFMVTLASYYTIALYLFFSAVDYIFYPDLFLEFLGVRLLVVVTLLVIDKTLRADKKNDYNQIQLLC